MRELRESLVVAAQQAAAADRAQLRGIEEALSLAAEAAAWQTDQRSARQMSCWSVRSLQLPMSQEA
jgi:hypothetical protein